MAGELQVVFRLEDELDLVFQYLDRQEQVLKEQGQPMLPYRIEFNATEAIVCLDIDGAGDDPLGLQGNGKKRP